MGDFETLRLDSGIVTGKFVGKKQVCSSFFLCMFSYIFLLLGVSIPTKKFHFKPAKKYIDICTWLLFDNYENIYQINYEGQEHKYV